MSHSASGMVTADKTSPLSASVVLQPTDSISRLRAGVSKAIPAMDPVERKNRDAPRWRVNYLAINGVNATVLMNDMPNDSSTPMESRHLIGQFTLYAHIVNALNL